MSGICRVFCRTVCRDYVGTMSGLCRDYVGTMSVFCRTVCRYCVGTMSVLRRDYVGPYVGYNGLYVGYGFARVRTRVWLSGSEPGLHDGRPVSSGFPSAHASAHGWWWGWLVTNPGCPYSLAPQGSAIEHRTPPGSWKSPGPPQHFLSCSQLPIRTCIQTALCPDLSPIGNRDSNLYINQVLMAVALAAARQHHRDLSSAAIA